MCNVFLLLHLLQLYRRNLAAPHHWPVGDCQLCPAVSVAWWHTVRISFLMHYRYCPQAGPIRVSNITALATNSHNVICLSTSELTEGLHSQPRSYSHSNWVNKHAKRDPCSDADGRLTEMNKYANWNQDIKFHSDIQCFWPKSWTLYSHFITIAGTFLKLVNNICIHKIFTVFFHPGKLSRNHHTVYSCQIW